MRRAWVVGALVAVACDPKPTPCGELAGDPRGLYVLADERGFVFDAPGASVLLDVIVTARAGDRTRERFELFRTADGWTTERFRCTPEGGCRLRMVAPDSDPCAGPEEAWRVEWLLEGHPSFVLDYDTAVTDWELVEACPWGDECFRVRIGPQYLLTPAQP